MRDHLTPEQLELLIEYRLENAFNTKFLPAIKEFQKKYPPIEISEEKWKIQVFEDFLELKSEKI